MKLEKGVKYVIGKPEQYTSIYGYKKNKLPVRKVDGGESVGIIKEEEVLTAEGKRTGVMYYERNGWKNYGQKRFYESPEALILACGGQIAPARDIAKQKAIAEGKVTELKPEAKKVAKKPARRKVATKLAPKRKKSA